MSSKGAKGQEPRSYEALLDENRALQDEVQNLKARLAESEELRRTISEGDLDALVIPRQEGELIFTQDSADQAYRVLVENMNEGTATLAFDGTILYCNHRFAELLRMPLKAIIGTSISRFIEPESAITFKVLLEHKIGGEAKLRVEGGKSLPVYLSISSLQAEGSPNAWCLVVTDLTEQKKNEEILTSERLARSIIEQAAETIVVCDTSGRIIRFSNAMPKLCGCDPIFQLFEDLIDLRFSEGADSGESILPVSSALKGSTILGVGATLEPEDTQKFNFLLNSGPLKNDNGEIIGCVVTLTDITERKQAEEALRQSEQHYRLLFETMLQGVVYQDANGKIISMNPAAERILGKTTAEFLGSSSEGEEHYTIREDGSPFPGLEHPAMVSLRTGREVQDVVMGVYNPRENCYRWININAVPIIRPGEDKPFEVYTLFNDITERKQDEETLRKSEKRYRTLFNTMEEGFCIIEMLFDENEKPIDYIFVETNPAFEKDTGLKNAVGKRIRELAPGE